eukprot:TRINITY_DN55870_c0_g1_i1.p2 TRINITY_DN55870_c0_g1~~TRINITY_DN55870_c0_g1_i1.p2  ORF type:complete len:534 (+),score=65.53 TRINITY_DN55870_c0_g1_i1:25-1626(+)
MWIRIGCIAVAALFLVGIEANKSSQPGVNVGIGPKFMQTVANELVYSCNRVLPGRIMPDHSGGHTSSYPKVKYTLSHNLIQSASCSGGTAKQGGSVNEINFQLTGVNMELVSHLDAKQTDFPYVHPQGTLTSKVSDGTFNIVWSFSADPSGELKMSGSATADVDADVSYSGHDSWFVSPMLFFLGPFMNDIVSDEIGDIVSDEIAAAAAYIENLPLPYALPSVLGAFLPDTINWDWGLVSSPTWRKDSKGNELFVIQSRAQWVYAPPYTHNYNYTLPFYNNDTMPYATGTDDLQLVVSDFTLDTFLYTAYEAGATFMVNSSIIPSSFPFKLNTTDLKGVIPALYKAHPDELLNIGVRIGNYPRVDSISDHVLYLATPIDMDWYIENSMTYCFTLRIDIQLLGAAVIETNPTNSSEWNVHGQVKSLSKIHSTLVSSAIGNFSTSNLDAILYDISKYAPSAINKFLGEGYNIPKKIPIGAFGMLDLNDFAFVDDAAYNYFGLQMTAGFNGPSTRIGEQEEIAREGEERRRVKIVQ